VRKARAPAGVRVICRGTTARGRLICNFLGISGFIFCRIILDQRWAKLGKY